MDTSQVLALLMLGAAVSALTAAIKAAGCPPRLLPLLPLLLGVVGAVAITSATPGHSAGERVLYGLLAGAFSGQLYESVKVAFNRALPPSPPPSGGA